MTTRKRSRAAEIDARKAINFKLMKRVLATEYVLEMLFAVELAQYTTPDYAHRLNTLAREGNPHKDAQVRELVNDLMNRIMQRSQSIRALRLGTTPDDTMQ